jgi:peroxiredoxin family protein
MNTTNGHETMQEPVIPETRFAPNIIPTENLNKGKINKMMIILSKATLENVYAAFVLANGARMEGIEAEMFFTFFGLEAVQKSKMDSLHVATVGNPGMHIPTMIGGLPGMEALATYMMKKEMDKIDIPPVPEFLEILKASGVKMWACKLAMDMFHLTKSDLADEIDEVITVGDFYAKAQGEGVHILFV